MAKDPCVVSLRGEPFWLLPERAVFWPRRLALIVADVHWGKSETFQAHGLPVPSGAEEEDVLRLVALGRSLGARRAIVLGDLIHGPLGTRGERGERLADLFARSGLAWHLIVGNHDRQVGFAGRIRRVQIHPDGLAVGPFSFRHEPRRDPAFFTLAGHEHPVVRLGGRADRLRLPCFRLLPELLVLPAYGSTTGGFEVRPAPRERCFVTTGEEVVELTGR